MASRHVKQERVKRSLQMYVLTAPSDEREVFPKIRAAPTTGLYEHDMSENLRV